MSVQFGLGIMRMDSVTLGYLQGVTLDYSFDEASLYSGSHLFPIDVRVHTGTITGNAEYADMNARGIAKLFGSTANTYGKVNMTSTTSPGTWQCLLNMTTDNLTFRVQLNKCRANKVSFAFARDGHVIPNFDFSAYADVNSNIGHIVLEDVS